MNHDVTEADDTPIIMLHLQSKEIMKTIISGCNVCPQLSVDQLIQLQYNLQATRIEIRIASSFPLEFTKSITE